MRGQIAGTVSMFYNEKGGKMNQVLDLRVKVVPTRTGVNVHVFDATGKEIPREKDRDSVNSWVVWRSDEPDVEEGVFIYLDNKFDSSSWSPHLPVTKEFDLFLEFEPGNLFKSLFEINMRIRVNDYELPEGLSVIWENQVLNHLLGVSVF